MLRVVTGTRPGRGHRRRGTPCQDAVAGWADPSAPRAVAAVADGLGSCPLSEHGSQAAVAAVADGKVLAAMVGDGAVVAGDPVVALLAPVPGGYANEVVPLTAEAWRTHVQQASLDAAGPVAIFSDGLTRLLLERAEGAWRPFTPFFSAFFPAIAAGEPAALQRWLDGDDVDQSWDDDKGLAVIHARA